VEDGDGEPLTLEKLKEFLENLFDEEVRLVGEEVVLTLRLKRWEATNQKSLAATLGENGFGEFRKLGGYAHSYV